MGFVRSRDRPAGNAAASDQPAAAAKIIGDPENIGADGSAATTAPAAATGAGDPEPAPDRDETASGERPGSGEGRDIPLRSGESGTDGPNLGHGDLGAEDRTAAPRPGRSPAGPAARLWARAGFSGLGRRSGQRPDRQSRYPEVGGAAFARLTVLPAILMAAWLLVGLPLLLAGVLLPAPMLLVAVLLAVLLSAGLQRIPARWPRVLPGPARPAGAKPRRERGWPAWWGLAGTIVVAGGFAFWQFLFNSESVIVLRDPGAYLQTGYWIAQHGSLPIPQSLAAFGGAHPGLTFASTGFFAHGTSVVPGLMSGLPLLLAGAFWVHGTSAAAAMGPILGGVAVLAFGGLVGRLAGPQWAPAGALVLACTLPEQYTSRASFSETAAQVLLFGGLSLVVDALTLARARTETAAPAAAPGAEAPPAPPETRPLPPAARPSSQAGGWRRWLGALSSDRDRAPEWALMALGGLALGLTSLVRFDGLLYVLPAIPFIGILVVRRDKNAIPFCAGLAIGAAYGLADGYLLARPFVNSLQPMPELIGLIAAWLLAMTVAGVELLRLPGFREGLRPVLARRPLRWLPELGAILAVAAIIGFAIRPYVQTVRGPPEGRRPIVRQPAAARAPAGRSDPGDCTPRTRCTGSSGTSACRGAARRVRPRAAGAPLPAGAADVARPVRRDPRLGAAAGGHLLLARRLSSGAGHRPRPAVGQPPPGRPWCIPGLIICASWAAAWLAGRARNAGRRPGDRGGRRRCSASRRCWCRPCRPRSGFG